MEMIMPALVIVGIPLFIAAVWLWATYNGFVKLRNQCRESWSNVDTELKRRYDLIPNLVATVKGYAAHEKGVLENVAALRNAAVASTGSPTSQAADENNLVKGLRTLLAVVERYPDLKANTQFLALQKELANTEDRIQAARRFFNANVRDLNTRVGQFPSNFAAGWFGFTPGEYFEVESIQTAVPSVAG
ncbi:MAG: LemA family protein [Planctomycetota bacterium]